MGIIRHREQIVLTQVGKVGREVVKIEMGTRDETTIY